MGVKRCTTIISVGLVLPHMQSTVFVDLAELITVQNLQTPLGPDVFFGESISDAFGKLMEACIEPPYDPMDRVSLVIKEEKVVGCTFLDSMLPEYNTIGDEGTIDPIEPSKIVATDMKVLDFLDIIPDTDHFWYFVLQNNRITGTIGKHDLFKLPFRLCLLALTLELEQEILQLALQNPKESWECMSSERRAKIERIYKIRYESEPSIQNRGELLACTSLGDKGVILRKTQKLSGWSKKNLKSAFHHIEDLRNACAHTNSEERMHELTRSIDFKQLVNEMQELSGAIQTIIYK